MTDTSPTLAETYLRRLEVMAQDCEAAADMLIQSPDNLDVQRSYMRRDQDRALRWAIGEISAKRHEQGIAAAITEPLKGGGVTVELPKPTQDQREYLAEIERSAQHNPKAVIGWIKGGGQAAGQGGNKKMDNLPDRYLGDGVYASTDGYHIILDLRKQDDTTRIAMEPAVMKELNFYAKQLEAAVEARHREQQAALRRQEVQPQKGVTAHE